MRGGPVTVGHIGEPPWADIMGQRSVKYAGQDWAMAVSRPWVSGVIARLLGFAAASYAHTVVDVKLWNLLKVGDIPAIPGWHLDCVGDEQHPQPHERHILYQFGAGCPTAFRDYPGPREGDITVFGRHWHSATPATRKGPRLLVRVTQCDNIRPRRGRFVPSVFRGERDADVR